MNAAFKATAKKVFRAIGLQEEAQLLWGARSAAGRRNIRDDRQLRFLIRATLMRTSNCIDVGAAQGQILREMVLIAPRGRHMAFEPIPAELEVLRAEFPSVQVHGIALSDYAGQAEFHIADMLQSSGLQRRDWLKTRYRTIRVSVSRLDELVPLGEQVDLIKIDVEGAQIRVLRGATRVLAEHGPVLWIEHGDKSAAAHGTTRRDLWNLLVEHDYRLFTADGDGPLTWDGFDSPKIKRLWTFLAHR